MQQTSEVIKFIPLKIIFFICCYKYIIDNINLSPKRMSVKRISATRPAIKPLKFISDFLRRQK